MCSSDLGAIVPPLAFAPGGPTEAGESAPRLLERTRERIARWGDPGDAADEGGPILVAAVRAAERLVAARARSGLQAAPRPTAPSRPAPPLSRREQQVLELLARGHTRREIAAQLGIGVKSIETYRSRLAHKLGAHTRADLVRYALESGMLRASA